jgi:hypothetical protein
MLKSIFQSTVAAVVGFFAISAAAVSFSWATTIDGGSSAVVDGWNIAPDVGITLQATVDGNGNLAVVKNAVFTSNAPLEIQFTEVNPPGDILIYLPTETVTDSTGTNWTGFTFTLNGSNATISGIPFTPPAGTGYNYSNVQINAPHTVATYSGSQDAGSTSNWGGLSAGDQFTIDAPIPVSPNVSSFTLTETPIAQSGITSIPLPAAVWQICAGLLALGLVAVGRRGKSSNA